MVSIRTHAAVLLVLVSLYRYLHSDVYPTPRPTHWSERASCMVPVPRITRQYATLGRLQKTKSSDGEWMRLLLLLAGDIERNPGPGISDVPGMDELINLRGKTRYIDIPKEIGMQGYKVGTALLKDATSTVVPAIEQKYGYNTERVNFEILRHWVRGEGILDRTWGGLLTVLGPYCVSLAAEIAEALGVEECLSSQVMSVSESLQSTQAPLHYRQFSEHPPHPSAPPQVKSQKVLTSTSPTQSTQVPLRSHQFSEHHPHPSASPQVKSQKVVTSTSTQSPLPAQQQEGGSATGGNATGGSATGGNAIGSYAKATGGNAKATGGNATVYNIYNVTAIGGKATGGGATGGGATGGGTIAKTVDEPLHFTPPSQLYQFSEQDPMQPPLASQSSLHRQQLAPLYPMQPPQPQESAHPIPSQPQQLAHPRHPQLSKLSIFLHYLKSTYLQDLPEGLKWPPTPTKVFINLAIIGKDNVAEEEQDKFRTATLHGDVDDILDYKSPISKEAIFDTEEGNRLKCVLVEGAPGVGKSTLAWEVCQQWAKGALYQQYEMVLLLRLRDETVQNAMTMKDLILYEDENYQQEIAEHVKCCNGKNLLIILEGLDELPKYLFTEHSIFTKLISGKALPLATILITSRPSATIQLRQRWHGKISRHIEVLGFTEDLINEYISSVLTDEELQGFKTYIYMAPSIQRLMYIPLHSAIVVQLYRAYRKKCKPLPTSLSGLYKCLVQTILLRHLDCHPKYKDNEDYMDIEEFKDLPRDVYAHFYKLAELAYDGVKEQMLIFKDQQHAIEHLGFMNQTPELFPNCRVAKYSSNFLHLSVQEYFAAYYITQKSTHEQEQLLESIFLEKHLRNTGRFLAGITKFEGLNRDTVKRAIIRECSVDHFKWCRVPELLLSSYSLHLIYEAESTSMLDGFSYYKYTLSQYSPLFDWFALGYCIANTNYKWKLGFTNSIEDATEGVQLLCHALNVNSTFTIDEISCYCKETETEGVQLLLLGLPLHTLPWITTLILGALPPCLPEFISKLTRLHKFELRVTEDTALASTLQALAKADTLKKLEFSLQNCNACIAILSKWLVTSTHLETLTVMNLSASACETLLRTIPISLSVKTFVVRHSQFSIPAMKTSAMLNKAVPKVILYQCKIVADIAEALLSNTELSNLYLSHNSVGVKAVAAIAKALVHTSSTALTSLNISSCSIGGEGVTAISQSLQNNTTLTNLDISGNKIGDEGATAIGQSLSTNTALTCLNISKNSFGDEGVTAIAQALQSNSTLTWLDISINSIGDEGVTAIGQALQSNTTLKSLDMHADDGIGGWINGDEAVIAISQALLRNTTLRSLDISYILLGNGGVTAIGQALQSNTTLTALSIRGIIYFDGNSFGDDGAIAISQALCKNTALTSLNICNNNFGDEGATAIGQALWSNTTLTWLNICGNLIGDEGATAIAQALQSNSELVSLYIRGNSIGDKGATSISRVLQSNTVLTSLDISENLIGDKGVTAIAKALIPNTTLRHLWLDRDNISSEGYVVLQESEKVKKHLEIYYVHYTVGTVSYERYDWEV